jgi:hypothetical protein
LDRSFIAITLGGVATNASIYKLAALRLASLPFLVSLLTARIGSNSCRRVGRKELQSQSLCDQGVVTDPVQLTRKKGKVSLNPFVIRASPPTLSDWATAQKQIVSIPS